jgi:hypothetical protein
MTSTLERRLDRLEQRPGLDPIASLSDAELEARIDAVTTQIVEEAGGIEEARAEIANDPDMPAGTLRTFDEWVAARGPAVLGAIQAANSERWRGR